MIITKSKREIELMRESGKIATETMAMILDSVKPGITTKELDKIAYDNIKRHKAEPSFLGYDVGGPIYPASICASVNDVIIHGIPGKRRLKDGDIISIDLGVFFGGYHSDMARTVPVGNITPDAQNLIKVTKECFYKGMEQAVIGNRIVDIGRAVQKHAEENGMSVVREFVGHGVGQQMHEEPEVPNYETRRKGPVLCNGMVIAIEPMINLGVKDIIWGKDGWSVSTADGQYSAHYENTIAVTENGPDILTYLV